MNSTPAAPIASIIILTYNGLEYTRLCLDSVIEKTSGLEYELILVDNASSDETPEYLLQFAAEHDQVKLILNPENVGFSAGNNIGARAASGQFLVFLNNDVVVTHGWLSGLLTHLDDPQVGMVGPVTNNSRNESRIKVLYDDLEGMPAFAREYTRQRQGLSFEIRMLPFLCVALRRAVFEQVGPLDERFNQGMFEDDDYALRLREAGYRLICAEDVFIHHWGSAGFFELALNQHWKLFQKNLNEFEQKWNQTWHPHQYRQDLQPLQMHQLLEDAMRRTEQIQDLTQKNEALSAEIEANQDFLEDLYRSRGWRLLQTFWRMQLRLAPKGSLRLLFLQRLLDIVSSIANTLAKPWRKFFQRLEPTRMSWAAYSFDRFKRARDARYSYGIDKLDCPVYPSLVTIVLPVFNGADYVSEALESILQQTYSEFEVIVVDDGSTDETPQIIRDFEQRDSRLRVISQPNLGLPSALNTGFQAAQGEFLTWTSADNRLKPDFLIKLVECLRRHPNWDMVYANQDIIDEEGEPLKGSSWYHLYQNPPGSQHIFMPEDPSELNIIANNYVGGAFMYRNRVDFLLGDYSPRRFGTEDYDYWMRVNALLNLRHADFQEPIYEYRFHSASLTSRDDELGITRNREGLMVFEDARRDFYLHPLAWIIEDDAETLSEDLAEKIRVWARCVGHVLLEDIPVNPGRDYRLWFPRVGVKVIASPSESRVTPDWPTGTYKVLIFNGDDPPPDDVSEDWDLCLSRSASGSPFRLRKIRQGWLFSGEIETLCEAIDIRVRSKHLSLLEDEITNPPDPDYKISVIICTYHRGSMLRQTIQSVARQTMPLSEYEVIVVNNDPLDGSIDEIIAHSREAYFVDSPHHLKLLDCPFQGLSFARNAGISEARGEIIAFIDDDAQARTDWLSKIWDAAKMCPKAGVIGGKIVLHIPEPKPSWLKPGWEEYWSQYLPKNDRITRIENWGDFPWGANWSARRQALMAIGGFRTSYGRRGEDFGGGEELVAACLIQKLNYDVVVNPNAEVLHMPEKRRFTFKHVWRTILAGANIKYQQMAEFYVPGEPLLTTFKKPRNQHLNSAIFGSRLALYQRLEHLLHAWAYFQVIRRMRKDLRARERTPYVYHF